MDGNVKRESMELLIQKAGRSQNLKRGHCERHGHYCPQLDIQRTAFLHLASECMVTAEEKAFLSNARGSFSFSITNEDEVA